MADDIVKLEVSLRSFGTWSCHSGAQRGRSGLRPEAAPKVQFQDHGRHQKDRQKPDQKYEGTYVACQNAYDQLMVESCSVREAGPRSAACMIHRLSGSTAVCEVRVEWWHWIWGARTCAAGTAARRLCSCMSSHVSTDLHSRFGIECNTYTIIIAYSRSCSQARMAFAALQR